MGLHVVRLPRFLAMSLPQQRQGRELVAFLGISDSLVHVDRFGPLIPVRGPGGPKPWSRTPL